MMHFCHLLPSDWSHRNFNEECTFEEIHEHTSLYNRLDSMVNGTFKLTTTKIVKVMNPYLYLQYLLKKEEYEVCGGVTVKQLLHDTAAVNIGSITRHNLDYRFPNRIKYGRGVSFSPYAHYANRQSSRCNGRNRAMIIADVLINKIQTVRSSVILPEVNYVTTLSYDGNVYVKFYDNEYYPKYIVYYTNRC